MDESAWNCPTITFSTYLYWLFGVCAPNSSNSFSRSSAKCSGAALIDGDLCGVGTL
eukprot:CCRYP_005582-RA/>CCRYP_005582-RA protein AED:0.00 eAED:0.00 QI:134/1/1/1/0/0/2/92/55